MAEKPRLKKSDEILGSIAVERSRASKKAGDSSPRSASDKQERRPHPEPKSQELDFDDEEIELNDQPVLPSAQSLAEKLLAREDKRKQLNFGKYELPKREAPSAGAVAFNVPTPAPRPALEEVSFAIPTPDPKPAPEPVSFATPPPAPPPVPVQTSPAAPPARRVAPAAPSVVFEQAPPSSPVVMEYTFQSFEQQDDDRPVREFQMEQGEAQQTEPRRSARERQRKRGSQYAGNDEADSPAEPVFEPQFDFDPAPPPPARVYPAAAPERPPAPQQAPPPPPPAPVYPTAAPERPPAPQQAPPPPPPPPEPQIPEEERSRQDFLKRIANQFELQFEEKFEQGTLPSRDAMRRTFEAKPPAIQPEQRREAAYTPPKQARPEPEPVLAPPREEEDFFSYVKRQERERAAEAEPEQQRQPFIEDEAPASDFIAKFQRDIRKEEQERAEDFKDTLAEKFARERERYLKELNLSSEEPDEPETPQPAAQPQRRKLDFQIQPEMHLRDGEAAPAAKPAPKPAAGGPVTYTRGGAAKSLLSDDEPAADSVSTGMSTSRKTAEQLLMEHSVRAKTVAVPAPPKPAKLQFTFSTPDEQKNNQKKPKTSILPTEKWPRRIVLTAMAAGLFAIGLLLWPLVKYMQLSEKLSTTPDASSQALPVNEDLLNVYNDMSYTDTAKANSVMFKNANVTLKNIDVADYVVIEGIDSKGKIRLEDVSVDTAVSVKTSAIDTLELHNVKANRVIINNPSTNMTISATGSTDVGVVELRTPATVSQAGIDGDSQGIRAMVITPAEAGASINAKLSGLALQTLSTSASESIIAFENDSRAETVSVDGSLSLTGTGSIVNLAIGAKSGLGAGDIQELKQVTLFVKGVTITNLNVKSPANLNLSTTVDNVYTSDSVLIGGDGNLGALTLNPKAGYSGRLLIDVAGLSIQSLYSNTASRVNITGSAHVNTLTADESTYALGNKVNYLKVNADNVIYENEPDKIDVMPGVRPPQSKAENPNLDYNLGLSTAVPDTTGQDFATTCGHSRESGGFLLGNGSKDAPFEVSTPAQLSHVSLHLGSYFIQTSDIDISSDSRFSGGFTMIGSAAEPFTGTYDGNGFPITRLRIISSDENVGLFASNKGTIQNVRLVSGEINSNASSLSYVGGIAGLNSDAGSIRSCSNGAAVNGNQNTYTGGIVGYNFGAKVHDCYNFAKISGLDVVGGLVGFNRQSATLTGSYNAGAVDGRDEIGAVAGKNESATIANCYYLISTADFGIGTGSGTAIEKSSAELQDPQMAADLTAGNENSLWVPGDTATNGYHYPMHRKPTPTP